PRADAGFRFPCRYCWLIRLGHLETPDSPHKHASSCPASGETTQGGNSPTLSLATHTPGRPDMSTADRPVLITGGTGFIGSHVPAPLRDRGRRVCRADIRALSPEVKFVLGDHAATVPIEHASIDNWPRLLEVVRHWQPRQIVHLGGIVDPLFLFKNPSTAFDVNLEGTSHLLGCALLIGVDTCL